jgi:hypothetical protein
MGFKKLWLKYKAQFPVLIVLAPLLIKVKAALLVSVSLLGFWINRHFTVSFSSSFVFFKIELEQPILKTIRQKNDIKQTILVKIFLCILLFPMNKFKILLL